MFCQDKFEHRSYICQQRSIPMAVNRSKSSRMRRQPQQARSQERVNQILDVAEQMFISEGYKNTTTRAIAVRARVPVGSLYQFFPNKKAILQALAMRYTEILSQRLAALDIAEARKLSLSTYVDRLIDTVEGFFSEYPGYRAIYIQMQGTIAELEEIENTTDARLIESLGTSISQLYPDWESVDKDAIAFVLVKAIGNLLWLSLSQEPDFKGRLIAETKRLALNYLQSYLPIDRVSVKHLIAPEKI